MTTLAAAAGDDGGLKDFPLHLIRVSNKLIELGSETGPDMLRQYVLEKRRNEVDYNETQLFYVCRMIYYDVKNLASADRMGRLPLGETDYTIEQELSLPDFPLLFANGMPFIVIREYYPEEIKPDVLAYLDKCQLHLKYRTQPYAYTDLRKAADVATAMIMNNALLNDGEQQRIRELIVEQSEV